ncbi:MAG: hypothetical protein HXY40_14405 [Chloroflexi bacterium]|nr:hypothetical protein [Chloroflexota bacterium]
MSSENPKNPMWNSPLILIVIALIVVGGALGFGSVLGRADPVTPTAEPTVPTATVTPIEVIPTASSSPTATEEMLMPSLTATSTPMVCLVRVLVASLYVRSGPGTGYQQRTYLNRDSEQTAVEMSAYGQWWNIGVGWIAAGGYSAPVAGYEAACAALPVSDMRIINATSTPQPSSTPQVFVENTPAPQPPPSDNRQADPPAEPPVVPVTQATAIPPAPTSTSAPAELRVSGDNILGYCRANYGTNAWVENYNTPRCGYYENGDRFANVNMSNFCAQYGSTYRSESRSGVWYCVSP